MTFFFLYQNLIFFYDFRNKSSILKSIFRFQISLSDYDNIDFSHLFFIYCLPLTSMIISVEVIFLAQKFKENDFCVLFMINQLIAYSLPFLMHVFLLVTYMYITISISKVFDIKVNDFENIFQEKYYTDKYLNFDSTNLEKVLVKQTYDEDIITKILSIFSAKLHILNIYQNKINNCLWLQITIILCESISWLIFGPFQFNWSFDIILISLNILYFSVPSLLFLTSCIVPEIVLIKVSI